MINFSEQTGNFNYSFEFSATTGNAEWSLRFGKETGHVSIYDNLIYSGNISGTFDQSYSLQQNNEFLAVGDPVIGIVDIYENYFYSMNSGNEFIKINQLTGVGVSNISGFGKSISLEDDTLIVGAPYTNNNQGASFVFQQFNSNGIGVTGENEWGQKTVVSGSQAGDYFGCSHASIAEDTEFIFAIGATGKNNGSGAVHLYRQTLSESIGSLIPEEENVKKFGRSLYFTSVENIKYLAIGYEHGGTGKIKMYKESTPGQRDFTSYRTIQSDSPSSGDLFGYSLDGYNDYIIFGCPNENNSGAAYYYQYNNELGLFENKQRIAPTDLSSGNYFGKNISFDDRDGIITSNHSSGKAYIYYRNDSWEQVATVTGNNINSGSFGGDVSGSHNTSLYHNLILIGSTNETGTYVYTTGAENFNVSTGFSISGIKGKIYDNDGRFLFGYSPNTKNTISGNVFSNYSNIFINNHLYNSNISKTSDSVNGYEISGEENLISYVLEVYNVET